MANQSSGTKNQPLFTEAGAPELATDANLISNYAAKVGNRRCGTTTERNAATGSDLWEGLEWYDTTLNQQFIYDGSGWSTSQNIYAQAAGVESMPFSSGENNHTITVTWPTGRFSQPPVVVATLYSAPNGSQKMIPRFYNVSSTNGTLAVYTGDFSGTFGVSGTVSIAWHAIQMTSTTAEG